MKRDEDGGKVTKEGKKNKHETLLFSSNNTAPAVWAGTAVDVTVLKSLNM